MTPKIQDELEKLEGEAESIIMAVEVGMFHGTRSEYAHALLVISGRDKRESDNSELSHAADKT